MTTIKQAALVAAGILCVLVFPTGVMCAGAPTASSEAAYKAATDTDPHRPLTEYQQKMRAQKIQAAASELSGEQLRWTSVKGTLAAYAEGAKPRFERVRHGHYRIKKTRLSG